MTRMRRPSSAVKSRAISTSDPLVSSPTRSIAAWPSSKRESTIFKPGSMPSTFSATSFSKSPMSLTSSFRNVGLIVISPGLSAASLAHEHSKRGTKGMHRNKYKRNMEIFDFRLGARMAD